ncbi:hypothetical protein J2W42_003958 [Rhizobium tibeticum]|uniref:Uncharacterized protein n=1 Tax=Rhizobium tibeticum TaxID=501024 RepID=A0A1H8N0Y0_9HYPH|nr:hypothetical protein [Rhizobium tibeticum]MDP9811095.1 hypothetical protein [Rhizobium tibeticum]SEI09895.1 hypothetical protein RTCCBAU85039_4486 [Rhizobium tibeticum]SEO23212.1 hypothetical protein SAMN05216228_1013168 [Rhizobium tibeticum]
MPYKRYGLEENSDSTWRVVDYREGKAAEANGAVLDRLPHDTASNLEFILNAQEKGMKKRKGTRKAKTAPQHPKARLMATERYSRRKNLNVYWTVVDATTGQPLVIDGIVMDMLSEEEAEELIERLNRNANEEGPFKRP